MIQIASFEQALTEHENIHIYTTQFLSRVIGKIVKKDVKNVSSNWTLDSGND